MSVIDGLCKRLDAGNIKMNVKKEQNLFDLVIADIFFCSVLL